MRWPTSAWPATGPISSGLQVHSLACLIHTRMGSGSAADVAWTEAQVAVAAGEHFGLIFYSLAMEERDGAPGARGSAALRHFHRRFEEGHVQHTVISGPVIARLVRDVDDEGARALFDVIDAWEPRPDDDAIGDTIGWMRAIVANDGHHLARRADRDSDNGALVLAADAWADAAVAFEATSDPAAARSAHEQGVGLDRRIGIVNRTVMPDGLAPSPEALQLTPAQQQVVALVLAGRSNDQIATTLFISRRTVESHLTSVFRRLGVSRRTQLVSILSPAT